MSSTTPSQLMFPSYVQKKLESVREKYTIRPYHPKDCDKVKEIFITGMDEYRCKTNNRTPFPSLDSKHREWMEGTEEKWAESFGNYVSYSLKDANMNDIENYWSLPRRSIFMVAVDNTTGEVAGTVAVQPGTYLAGCKYFSQYDAHLNGDIEIESLLNSLEEKSQQDGCQVGKIDTGGAKYSQFLSLCHYATGSLPADLYRIDDPIYDPTTFRPLPTVLLPDGDVKDYGVEVKGDINNVISDERNFNNSNNFIPNDNFQENNFVPNSKNKATCQCSISGKCTSLKTAIKASRCNYKQLTRTIVDIIKEESQNGAKNDKRADFSSVFCPCIISADQLITTLTNSSTPSTEQLPCPYCIEDAQYLVDVYLPVGEEKYRDEVIFETAEGTINAQNGQNDQKNTISAPQSPKYQYNPILSHYSNSFTSSNVVQRRRYGDWRGLNETTSEHIDTCSQKSQFDDPQKSSFSNDLPCVQKLPFYDMIPNGYHRRFQYLSNPHQVQHNVVKGLGSEQVNSFPVPMPQTLNRDTYIKFLLEQTEAHFDAKRAGIDLNTSPIYEEVAPEKKTMDLEDEENEKKGEKEEKKEENEQKNENEKNEETTPLPKPYQDLIDSTTDAPEQFYTRHINITPSLQRDVPYVEAKPCQYKMLTTRNENVGQKNQETGENTTLHLPYGDFAEFRRMSVGKPHRSTGLAYLLLAAALDVSTTMLKFNTMHLSTSRLMDMATKFYHRSGFHEVTAHVYPAGGTFGIPLEHFCWDLTPRVAIERAAEPFVYQYLDKNQGDFQNSEGNENDFQISEENGKKTIMIKPSGSLPTERFDQVAHVSDTFLGVGVQSNPKSVCIAEKLREFEAKKD